MVTTNNHEWTEKMRVLRLHGMSRDAWKRYSSEGFKPYRYELLGFIEDHFAKAAMKICRLFQSHETEGHRCRAQEIRSSFVTMATCNVSFTIRYKYNMTDIQAAIGLKQLPKLDRFNAIRDKLCQLYQEGLADLPEITLPPPPSPYVRHARHLFVIALNPGRLSIDRDRFVEALTAENIGVGFHFVALHLHPYYRRRLPYRPGDLPVAEDLSRQVVSLPLSPAHTEQDIADVITAVRRIVTYFRKR